MENTLSGLQILTKNILVEKFGVTEANAKEMVGDPKFSVTAFGKAVAREINRTDCRLATTAPKRGLALRPA